MKTYSTKVIEQYEDVFREINEYVKPILDGNIRLHRIFQEYQYKIAPICKKSIRLNDYYVLTPKWIRFRTGDKGGYEIHNEKFCKLFCKHKDLIRDNSIKYMKDYIYDIADVFEKIQELEINENVEIELEKPVFLIEKKLDDNMECYESSYEIKSLKVSTWCTYSIVTNSRQLFINTLWDYIEVIGVDNVIRLYKELHDKYMAKANEQQKLLDKMIKISNEINIYRNLKKV